MRKHLLCILTVLISTIIGASQAHAQVQWNTNLLQNTVPIGSQYKGWQKTDGGTGWDIDNGYFVSSFQECILKQTVTLADYGFTADNLSGQSLYTSVRYWIPWPGTRAYGGICIVAVVCLDESGNTLETLYLLNMQGYTNVDIASTVKDSLFVLPTGTTQLRYELHGRDQKNWGGYYGPRFTDMKMIVPNRDSTYTASIDPAIGDSITLSKTNGIHIGDTIEVSATYPEYPIRYLFSNGNQYINTNRLPCKGVDMVVSARFSYRHTITLDTQHATLTASKTSAYAGDTITLTRSMKEKHFFIRYIATPEVQWLDGDRFIMPDEDIEIRIEALFAHTLPFFEGFENGNKQGAAVSGWLQQQIFAYQNEVWKANSTDTAVNRAPYMGKWNANLFRGNTRLLFTYLRLEAGVEYRISMYARQNATTGAAIQVLLGDTFERDAMTQTILPTTQITDGDYQHLTAVFSVSESKDYALGIYGYIGYDDAIYLSLDNISITRNQQNPIRCTLSEAGTITASKTSATVGDTITLSHTMSTGYLFIRYATNIDVHWLDSNRFVMPYTDVQIDMETFDPHPIRFTSSEAGTITADKTNAPVGDTITLSHTMNAGYRFIRYTATPEVQWLNDTCFIMLDKEVEIGMEVNAPHPIRFTPSEAGTITADKTNAPIGDTITLSHTMNAGYRFIRYTATPEVRWLDDNRFIMLDKEVEIDMEVNAPHSIRFTPSEAGTITADKTNAPVGDTITLSHTMNAGYRFIRYTATPEVQWLINDTCFIMPDKEVEIGMEVNAPHSIRFTPLEAGTITADKTNAPVGDTITLSHTMNAGYRFIRYTATPEVQWLINDTCFIMPDKEVEIGMEVNAPHSIRFTPLEAGTITADKTNATVGDTVALSHTMNARYIFVRYTATPEVRWFDDNHFIMLDEEVEIGMETIAAQTIPFFEGFEEGNTEGDAVSGWTQQNEIRTAKWQANQGSYRNTSPYQGAWNAILSSNNAAWLFRWVYLEAGKTYRLGMYARQNYADTDYANMSAYIGSALDKDSMLINVIPETGLTDGDYQLLASTFSVVQTGIYALGIRGMINTRAFFLSLDNISLDEYILHTIRTTESEHCTLTIDKTEAYMCDTVSVTANVNDGYFLDSVRTDISVEWIDDTRFIMPNADVVLTAYIHKAKTGVLHIINTDKASIRVLKDGVELPDNSIITEGDILCSVAVAGPGYKLYTISPDDTICSVVTGDRIVNDTLVMNTSGIGVRWFGPKPRVECPDSTTAIVTWDSIGCEYDILITDQEVSDFTFQKGIRHTADTAYTAQGLTEGNTYYAYLRADKAGEEEIWNSNKFVMLPTEFGESCTLIIDCYDSFGDGWNENALLVEENGLTTRFTFDDGSSETFTYLTQGGTITIYWEEGSYPRETSFVITTADGAVLVEVSDGSTLQDGEQLYFGNPCDICLQPVITNISHKGTDITVSWTNTGAASYNVALLNKGTATDEELAALYVSTIDTMYTFHDVDTCKYYMVYVQAQCDENFLSAWVTGYYAAQPAATLQWEPITLNFYVRGNDAIADGKAYPGTSNLCLLYRLTLTEAQTIYGHTIVDDNYTAMLIGSLKNDTLIPINSLFGNSVQLAAGDYGIMAVVKPGHEYEVFIAEVDTMQFTHITLPYLSDTIMNDGLVVDNIVGNGFFRGYEFTLNKTTTLEMSLKDLAPNEYAQLVLWRYENGQNNLTSNFMRQVQPLDSGTYRIGVFTYNQNVPYRLSLTASLPSFAFDTIVPDTVLTGTISGADRLYPMEGASLLSKAYTFTLEEQQCMNVRLYATPSDSMLVVFYTDSLLLEREDSREAVGMNDSTFYTDIQNRHGETKRYYMVVYNLTGEEQSFACALHTYFSADSVLASDTMHINEIKTLAFDAYSKCVVTNGYNGVYEAYTMHLEKDKRYRFYAEAPETALAMNIYAVDPARKEGHLSNNSIGSSSMVPEYRTAIATGVCPEEKDYTLVLTAYAPLKLHDEPKYMLAFEEMQDFRSLIGSTQEVVLPFRQDTAFGKVKYSGDNQWRWHPVNYDYISSHSIYSAAAYMVKVNAGDTLYASLTTDYDAVIHFYHFYGATDYTDCNMRIYDAYEGYPQIAEKGMYVNTTDSVETIVVIASDNNYRPGGNHYHLILSRSLSDINVEKTAFAEASESVIYCDSEISIVRDALSRLTLTAKDENGLTIGTIDNIAPYWDINLSTGIATYEVNDADLPKGYTFGGKAQITVSVRSWETVFPMADKSSIVLTEYTESAAREALGAVVLTAVDADGNAVHTFTNTPSDWTIDLTTGLATYTLQSTDLPLGYVFNAATATITIQLMKHSTDVTDIEVNHAVRVYPNPASDYTFVEGATDEIRVYDLTGRLVLSQTAAGEKTMLDVTFLPTGVYSIHTAGEVTPLMVK